MRGIRVVIGSSWLLGSWFGLLLLGGCSDPSRQTGTQVQVSEQVKAQDDEMRNMYKEKGQKKQ